MKVDFFNSKDFLGSKTKARSGSCQSAKVR